MDVRADIHDLLCLWKKPFFHQLYMKNYTELTWNGQLDSWTEIISSVFSCAVCPHSSLVFVFPRISLEEGIRCIFFSNVQKDIKENILILENSVVKWSVVTWCQFSHHDLREVVFRSRDYFELVTMVTLIEWSKPAYAQCTSANPSII